MHPLNMHVCSVGETQKKLQTPSSPQANWDTPQRHHQPMSHRYPIPYLRCVENIVSRWRATVTVSSRWMSFSIHWVVNLRKASHVAAGREGVQYGDGGSTIHTLTSPSCSSRGCRGSVSQGSSWLSSTNRSPPSSKISTSLYEDEGEAQTVTVWLNMNIEWNAIFTCRKGNWQEFRVHCNLQSSPENTTLLCKDFTGFLWQYL